MIFKGLRASLILYSGFEVLYSGFEVLYSGFEVLYSGKKSPFLTGIEYIRYFIAVKDTCENMLYIPNNRYYNSLY